VYLGLATALLDATNRANGMLTRELEWQNRVGGDPTQAVAFKDQVLNQQAFRAFASMKGKSPAIHLAHSIGVFFGLSGMATDIQGKQVAFVGDRGNSRQPIPFVLPPQNLWTWARARYLANMVQFLQHYALDKNQDKLWAMGAGEADLTEILLPRLLSLPMIAAKFVVQQGGSCLPHTFWAFLMDHIEGETSQVGQDKWQLILSWCLAASQVGADGSSILNLGAPEPAICQDEEFLDWRKQCLTMTLG
jgi:hypothetical protein